MKRMIRIVNLEVKEENRNEYYCEYSLDGGDTWSCESMFKCHPIKENPAYRFLAEDILWFIQTRLDNGFEYIGVKLSSSIKDWSPWL